MSLDPKRVERALSLIISDIDYDLHKEIAMPGDEGYSYPDMAAEFISLYEDS